MLTQLQEALMNNLGILFTAFLGFLGLLILAYELWMRRKLQEEELALQREQFKEEKEERKERLEWLRRETLTLTEVGEPLAKNIAKRLTDDNKWAVNALMKAKLGPRAGTLFGERLGHFQEEKEHLADNFLPLLLQRCRRLIESKKTVYLLLDSGTTIYPFFRRLGHSAIRCHSNNEDWIKSLKVATNSLPGVEELMETGRLDPNNRYSPLAINCELLPGVPLPIYSAVTGREAENAIKRIKQEASSESIFIGLITGNWIRLRRTEPLCPIPLARGTGHLEFKQTLIDNSDEIYVVTPLGKIFADVDPDEVNTALGFHEEDSDPDRRPYSEVTINGDKASYVKIVTTYRPSNFVLSDLGILVRNLLSPRYKDEDPQTFITADSKDVPHLFFPFKNLPENWFFQREIEFPHRHTRREEFMQRYFHVPNNRQ